MARPIYKESTKGGHAAEGRPPPFVEAAEGRLVYLRHKHMNWNKLGQFYVFFLEYIRILLGYFLE